jgi:hypothetical protein
LWIFWKVWNFRETSCIKWCNWKCMVFEQSYMSARKWSLVVSSHLRVAVWHPFLAAGGMKGAPWVPVREHVTPSTRPITYLWHVGGTSVPLLASSGRTQAIGPP